jgi:hypothetical protein
MLTTQDEPVPAQAPDHPANAEPEPAVAVSVTLTVGAKDALQVEPQSIPAGLLETVPEPVPVLETVSVLLPGGAEPSNWAVTVLEPETAQLPKGIASHPVNLTKTDPGSAEP